MNELYKISMTADVGGFVTGMAKAETATQRVGAGLTGLVGIGKGVSQAFGDIANAADKTLKRVRNVGIAGVTATVGWGIAAASYETKLRNVNALLHLNQSAFASLEQNTLSQSAKYPIGLGESANGLYQIVSASYQGKEATDLLANSLKTASAGLTDTETAANALIFALKAYGLSEKDVADVSDILFQTVNKGIVTFPQLAQGMGEWVGMAAAAKVPLEQAASALAAMTLAGLDPAESATSLARLVQSFIKPSESLTSEVHKLGYESPLTMLQVRGLRGSIMDLAHDTGGSVTAFVHMFNEIRAARGAFALISNEGKNYADVAASVESVTGRAGATQAAFAAQAGGAAFKFHVMVNELQRLAIQMGTPLLAPAKLFMGILTNIVTGLGDIPHPIRQIAAAGTFLFGVIATLIGMFGLWQIKSLLLAGVFRIAGGGLLSLGAKAEAAIPLVGARLGNALTVTGIAAQHAGGSFLKLGFGSFGIFGRIPIISQALSVMRSALTGVAIGAGIAVVAFAGWQLVKSALEDSDKAALSFWSNFQQGMKVENVTEFSGALENMRKEVNKQIDTVQQMRSGWHWIPSVLGTAIDLTHLWNTGTIDQLKTAEKGSQIYATWLDTVQQVQNIGSTVGDDVFTKLWKSNIRLNNGLKFTKDQILSFAEANDIQLFTKDQNGATVIDKEQLASLENVMTHYIQTWGKLPSAAKKSLDQVQADMKASAKYMQDYVDGVGKSFLDGFDVVKKFDNQFFETTNKSGDNKGALKNSFNIDTLKNFYTDALQRTSQFLADFRTGIDQGIDPQFLARVLTAGPNAAGDLLHAIVYDAKGQYRDLINTTEGYLSGLALAAVRQAKLIAIATQPGQTYQATGDLPKAQQLQLVITAHPKATISQLLKELPGWTRSDLERVGEEYAIPIKIDVVKPEDAPNVQQAAADYQDYLQGLLGKDQGRNAAASLSLTPGLIPHTYSSPVQSNFNDRLYNGPGRGSSLTTQADGQNAFDLELPKSVREKAKKALDTVGGFGFTLNVPFVPDLSLLKRGVKANLQEQGINLSDEKLDIIARLVYKEESGGLLSTVIGGRLGTKEKSVAINAVIGLIGDKDAHSKLMVWQRQLKLTPAELYTAFSIVKDQQGQDEILNWIAKVKHLNVQNIVVKLDTDGKFHFFKDIKDANAGINEIKLTTPPKLNVDNTDFNSEIEAAHTALRGLDGKIINTKLKLDIAASLSSMGTTHGHGAPYPGGLGNANGGTGIWDPSAVGNANGSVLTFADGGAYFRTPREPAHVAQIMPAGTWRVSGEPETGGEGYIPLAQSKRERSTNILGTIADLFGYKLEPKMFANGGIANSALSIIRGIQQYESDAARAGQTEVNTASFANAIAQVKRDNPATDKSSQASQNQAIQQIVNTMAHTYTDVVKAAGKPAADALVNSGLSGAPFDDAAQKIIDQATNSAQTKASGMEAKHTVGDISDTRYENFLKHQLNSTKKYSSEWMDAWQKLQDIQKKRVDDHRTLQQNMYDAGFTNNKKFEDQLHHQLAAVKKFSADWFTIYNQIKQLKSQDAQTRASIEDSQYQMGMRSADSYLRILQQRQSQLRKNTTEWWALQQQMKDLKATFAAPYRQATDITTAMSGQVVNGFSSVQQFYTHTLGQSQKYLNDLELLRKKGLNKTTLDELQKAGPADLSLADSILSGGTAGIKFVNDAQKSIDALATRATNFGLGKVTHQVTNIHLGGVDIHVGAGSTITEQQIRRQFDNAFKDMKDAIETDLGMGVK